MPDGVDKLLDQFVAWNVTGVDLTETIEVRFPLKLCPPQRVDLNADADQGPHCRELAKTMP